MSSLEPDDCRLVHVPRTGGKGSGVALISKKHYKLKVDAAFQATSFENMAVDVTMASYSFKFIVVYRNPPSSKNGSR